MYKGIKKLEITNYNKDELVKLVESSVEAFDMASLKLCDPDNFVAVLEKSADIASSLFINIASFIKGIGVEDPAQVILTDFDIDIKED